MASPKTVFTKPAFSVEEQIQLLEERGLIIDNHQRACNYLSTISYYRLGGYFIPFQIPDSNHQFKPGATFNDILNIYIFDRKLRLVCLDAIERIEVSVRTRIINILSEHCGPHCYLDLAMFDSIQSFIRFIKEVESATGLENSKRRSQFCKHYFAKYTPYLPPLWMVGEVLSLGGWSKLYASLTSRALKKHIAKPFHLGPEELESWLHALTNIRNICAHHNKLWDSYFAIQPKTDKYLCAIMTGEKLFYDHAVVVKHLLSCLGIDTGWLDRFRAVIETCPLPTSHMGFPVHWRKYSFWTFMGR